jgi:hypothetical protein
MVEGLQRLTSLTQLSFLGLEGVTSSSFDVWDSLAGAKRLGMEAAGDNWAFVSQAIESCITKV